MEAVSDVQRDRKDPTSIPVSAVDYEAAAYRMQEPMWMTEFDNLHPFLGVSSKEAAPSVVRRTLQASTKAFDVLTDTKMVADALVCVLKRAFSPEEDGVPSGVY